jgi:hypothetical protein
LLLVVLAVALEELVVAVEMVLVVVALEVMFQEHPMQPREPYTPLLLVLAVLVQAHLKTQLFKTVAIVALQLLVLQLL